MIKWSVLFEDDPERGVIVEEVEEQEHRAATLKRFDDAAKTGILDGRAVRGMWMVDHATEQEDVIKVHGLYPKYFETRHHEWKARGKKK